MISHRMATGILAAGLAFSTIAAVAQNSDSDNKNFDLKSTVGDVHMGSAVNLRELGLPAYPGARLRTHDENRNSANLAMLTSAFGFKLLVANYDSDDATGKIADFYRQKLKKYGKVLECHPSHHSNGVDVHEGKDDTNPSKELRCEGDNSGSVIELKAGTEDNQHVVAIEPAEKGTGSTIAMVYVSTRGKQGDI